MPGGARKAQGGAAEAKGKKLYDRLLKNQKLQPTLKNRQFIKHAQTLTSSLRGN